MLELMINNEVVKIATADPNLTLLEYLRNTLKLTGTKEGCASGDCGACTVVCVDLDEKQQLRYRQINSCITLLNSLHGRRIITVEHLKKGSKLHPIQKTVVGKHGTQCGFCTPGIVMSLYALSKQQSKPENPVDFLIGNLCRCTGYGPLIEAANQIADDIPVAAESESDKTIKAWMCSCQPQLTHNYLKPANRRELAALKKAYPDARFIAGGTDLALEITQQLNSVSPLIDLSCVDDLLTLTQTESGWRIGAALPLTDLLPFMSEHYPSTNELFARIGSLAIRNRATLGGSLGHASPIGDIAPLLISLKGQIEVDDGKSRYLYAPEDYITGYCRTRLQKQQWISAIHLPPLKPGQRHAIYKVSKRYHDDIATLVLAINLSISAEKLITECIIAAGGVAEKSVRLTELEALFIGKPLTQQLVHQVQAAVSKVIQPISDVRGSADYRMQLFKNLIQRFYLECEQVSTRLSDYE